MVCILPRNISYGTKIYLVNRLETKCKKALIHFHAIWGLCWYNFLKCLIHLIIQNHDFQLHCIRKPAKRFQFCWWSQEASELDYNKRYKKHTRHQVLVCVQNISPQKKLLESPDSRFGLWVVLTATLAEKSGECVREPVGNQWVTSNKSAIAPGSSVFPHHEDHEPHRFLAWQRVQHDRWDMVHRLMECKPFSLHKFRLRIYHITSNSDLFAPFQLLQLEVRFFRSVIPGMNPAHFKSVQTHTWE